jgi:hypothetical protein
VPWIPGQATALGKLLGNNLDFLTDHGAWPCDRWSSLLPCLADVFLQDGELLKVRLAPLAMVLLELLQQAYLEVHIHRAAIDVVALALVFKVDISQSRQERLEQGLKLRRIHPRLGRSCRVSFVVGHSFSLCVLSYLAEDDAEAGMIRLSASQQNAQVY